MALAAAMKWTVKTGGSAANSGGFTVGASGTDYSKQDSAQFSVTDLAIDAVTNTKVTSSTIGFDATSPGNTIIVSAGSGFTTGTYEILSVAAGVATLDRAVGTVGSTGGTAKLGGAKARLDNCDGVVVAGNTIYVEGGTYSSTTTNTLTADGTSTSQIRVIGYPSGGSQTDTDITEANMPVMTSATNSTAIITLNAAPYWSFRNLKITHTAATRGNGIVNASAVTIFGPVLRNCVFDGCLSHVLTGNTSATAFLGSCFHRCTFRNATSNGVQLGTGSGSASPYIFDSCDFSANAGAGLTFTSGNLGSLIVRNSVFRGQTGSNGYGLWFQETTAAWVGSAMVIDGCAFYSNAKSGVRFDFTTTRPATVALTNNVFLSNTEYGVSCATAGSLDSNYTAAEANFFYSNTSGLRQNFVTGATDVTMTGSPFTNAAGGDFTLNNTAGAGASVRQAGWPSAIGVSGTTVGASYPDGGPTQAQATGGGGTVAYGFAG